MSVYKAAVSGKIQVSATSLAPASVSKYQNADQPVVESKEVPNSATNRMLAEEIAKAAEHFVPKIRYSNTLSDYKEHALKLKVVLKQISTNTEGLIDPKKKNDRDGFMTALDDYVLQNVVPKKIVQEERPVEVRTKYETQLDPGLYLYQQEMSRIPILPQGVSTSVNQQYVSEILANKPQYSGNLPSGPQNNFQSRFQGNQNEGFLQSTGFSAAPGSAPTAVRVNSQHIMNAISGSGALPSQPNRSIQPRSNSRSRLDDLMATVTTGDPSPAMMGLRMPEPEQFAPPIRQQQTGPAPVPNTRLNSQAILSSMAYTYQTDARSGGSIRQPPQHMPDMLQHPEKLFVPSRRPL